MTGEKIKNPYKIDIFDLQTELQFQMKSADVVKKTLCSLFIIHRNADLVSTVNLKE